MIDPAVLGAASTILNDGAEPLVAAWPAGITALSVTAHCKIPAVFVQLGVPLMPCTAATLVYVVPAGRRSFTVTDVPDAVPPLLPIAIVYSTVPPVSTVAVPVFDRVKFVGVLTVVDALEHADVEQAIPGVGGAEPPVGSTEA